VGAIDLTMGSDKLKNFVCINMAVKRTPYSLEAEARFRFVEINWMVNNLDKISLTQRVTEGNDPAL